MVLRAMKFAFLIVALGLCCSSALTKSVRKRQMQDDFPDEFGGSCALQQEERPHISCEEDGSFSPLQCSRGMCRCVDPGTGDPVSEDFEEGEYDCVSELPPSEDDCPPFVCLLSCVEYEEDEEGCRICECVDGPEDEMSASETGSAQDDTTGDTTGSEDSTSGSCSTCPNIRRLLKVGCTRGCIIIENDCPACNDTCVLEGAGEEECSEDVPCEEGQVCVSYGPFGQHRCINLLTEGEICRGNGGDDDDDTSESESSIEDDSTGGGGGRYRSRIGGASDRHAIRRTGNVRVGCAPGLVCTRVGINTRECRPENPDGPCVQAREGGDSELSCDEDGYYEPLQCQQVVNSTQFTCRCVQHDGSVIDGTEVQVSDPEDGPDCEDLVYSRCEYSADGVSYSVRHGEDFLLSNCSRCQCEDGSPAFCEALSDCSSFAVGGQEKAGCLVDGTEFSHGDVFDVDCNRCRCRNGKITCTNRKCDNQDDEGICASCQGEPRNPVCAPDGRTYHSECYAVNCMGHSPVDLRPGACSIYNPCDDFSCAEGEICVPTGGQFCFNRDGCDPDDLRLCIDPNELMCEEDEDEDEEDEPEGGDQTPEGSALLPGRRKRQEEEEEEEEDSSEDEEENDYVCGTNCLSYSSLCQLLQDTAGTEEVAYAGRCNRPTCQSGQVCGTDGVTYDNKCVLRGRSNVRMDYEGECETESDQPTVEELCVRVSQARRCFYNTSNCDRLVRPEEGCCALCGGIVFTAIDFGGLSDYVRINPKVRTLDALLEVLVEDGFIPEEVTERCELEAQVTSTGSIEISLSAMDEDADAEFCNMQSQTIADEINSPTVVVPEPLQFFSAAVAAPTVQSSDETGGAPPMAAISCFSLFLMLLMTLLF